MAAAAIDRRIAGFRTGSAASGPCAVTCRLLFAVLLSGLLYSSLRAADEPADRLEVITDPETGLTGWHWQGRNLSVELVQLLPDQTRAFFMGRGFDTDSADRIARACVFQGILRNTSVDTPLDLDLARWRIPGSGPQGDRLRLNHEWQEIWRARDVPRESRIAFRWALFPTEQHFEPGDWLMGMIVLGRPPGERVDLELYWREDGRERRKRLAGIECPPDAPASAL